MTISQYAEFLHKKKLAEAQKVEALKRSEPDADALLGRASPVSRKSPVIQAAEGCCASDLDTRVEDALEVIKNVSRVSKGLKGTCQKELKKAVEVIAEAKEAWYKRTASEENERLLRERSRVSSELASLRAENRELREDLVKLRADLRRLTPERLGAGEKEKSVPRPPPQPQPDAIERLAEQMASLASRFDFLEGRMLRPPLRGDQPAPPAPPAAPTYAAKTAGKAAKTSTAAPKRTTTAAVKTNAASTPKPAAAAPPPSSKSTNPALTTTKRDRLKAGGAASASAPAAKTPAVAAPSASGSRAGGGEWQTAGAKKASKKARKKANKAARKRTAEERAKKKALRPPKSTAVVLTIQPSALEKGLNYTQVLTKTKEAINLEELGLATGVRLKTTRTGARLLEVPGAASGEKADALAKRLSELLSPEEVRVSRPVKTVELRVTGLDDSATVEELAAAVAKAGDCAAGDVRCGPIRFGGGGGSLGMAVVSCPVAAAKKVVNGRRVLVGWVSAQVKLLAPRPTRCFRCLAVGHIGANCTSAVDCSGKCFRCGQPGHLAASCGAAPHCLVCAAAGKSASHVTGGKSCRPSPPAAKKGGRKPAHDGRAAEPSTASERLPVVEVEMELQ